MSNLESFIKPLVLAITYGLEMRRLGVDMLWVKVTCFKGWPSIISPPWDRFFLSSLYLYG